MNANMVETRDLGEYLLNELSPAEVIGESGPGLTGVSFVWIPVLFENTAWPTDVSSSSRTLGRFSMRSARCRFTFR